MAPAGQYVFAEMLGISEHFTAGSHEWLPYSVIPTFPKLICKHQFIAVPCEPGKYFQVAQRIWISTPAVPRPSQDTVSFALPASTPERRMARAVPRQRVIRPAV